MRLVSVIISCYNLGQYLEETVDSVLAQTYQDFEIIIVNDGSTDPFTSQLLAVYQRPKTRVLTTENRGPGAARNVAIRVAHGPYICALDADDKLDPSYLEKAVKILDEDESITFVSCWLQHFGDENWVWKQVRCDLPTLLSECTVATPALVRRAAVMVVGGYDEDPAQWGNEDWLLWISLVERGYRGVILPDVLFYYRKRSGSLSAFWMQGEAHLEKLRRVIAKHEDSYRRHLVDLLMRKEAESCDLLKITYAMERHLETWLMPLVQQREAELERLRAKLEAMEQEPRLALRLEELKQEIFRLRNSKSWKITAPLRAIYELLLRLTRRPIPRN